MAAEANKQIANLKRKTVKAEDIIAAIEENTEISEKLEFLIGEELTLPETKKRKSPEEEEAEASCYTAIPTAL